MIRKLGWVRWASVCMGLVVLMARPEPLSAAESRSRRAAEDPPIEEAPVSDEAKKIEAAKTAEELVELAKEFVVAQQIEPATLALERAMAKKPALLEDSEKQTPKSWHDFWFAQRARLREKKLTPKDAAGRVKIALWLNDAGLGGPARKMLTTALAIDKNLPEAKELADKWSLASGGPIRIDLTYGLKEPLIVDTVQDEGQAVTPRSKERAFLILPLAYDAGNLRLMISKSDIKITADDGKNCPIVGIATLERSDTSSGAAGTPLADRARVPELKWPSGNEPLWERLQLEPAAAGGEPELIATNMMPPMVRPTPAPGGRGASREPPPPRPAAGPTGKQTRRSSGYAAFVVDVPLAFKTVECTWKGEPPIKLEADFLKSLSKPVENLASATERDKLLRSVAAQVASKEPAVASASLRKLNAVRLTLDKDAGGGEDSAPRPPGPDAAIDKLLVQGLAHENAPVRRDAFNLLLTGNAPLHATVIASIAQIKDPAILGHLTDEIRAYFADLAAEQAENPAVSGGASSPGGFGIEPGPADFAPLQAPKRLFHLMLAGLNSVMPPVREQVINVILANPAQQTLALLSLADNDAVGQLLAKVPVIKDARLKGAVMAALLRRGDKTQTAKVLAAFSDISIVVANENDPLMAIASAEGPADVQRAVLDVLARADLRAVADSQKLKQLIDALSAPEVKRDPAVRAAVLKFAQAQFKAAYEAPIKRGTSTGSPAEATGTFESLLASVAAGPNSPPDQARAAALTLLGAGRLKALNDRLQKLQGPTADARVQDFIQSFVREKSLWGREALPIFLAAQLASANPRTQQLAISALVAVQKGAEVKSRWRVNLAIKQGLEARQLVTLTTSTQEQVSRPALGLLRDLGAFAPAEAAEFETLPDESSRQDRLGGLEGARAGKAVGPMICMIYLDVRPADGGSSDAAAAKERLLPRNSVPLPSSPVTLQRSQDGKVRVIMDRIQIGPPEAKDGQDAAPPAGIRINAAPLIRAALESPDAQKEGLAGKINPASLRVEQVCDLAYVQLGQWGGELTFQEPPELPASEHPLKVTGARIIFEPAAQ